MGRSKRQQSKHDAEVSKVAQDFQKKGYEVAADVTGFSKPSTIGGYRPDVVAKKGWDRVIVEVETKDSVDTARDQGQQKAFADAAARAKHTKFVRKVAE